jgi:hypothetical protein
MKIKKLLKNLDATNSVIEKLEKIAIQAFLLAILIHELYKLYTIVAH